MLWNLLRVDGLSVLHTRAHWEPLLRTLLAARLHHQWSADWATWRWVTVRAWDWHWWTTLLHHRHWLTIWIHHLWLRRHQVWRSVKWSNLRTSYHNRTTHVRWLLWDKLLSSVGVRAELSSHLWSAWWHVVHDRLHSLLEDLSWLAHGWRWICHRNRLHAWRCERLGRERWHHAVVIVVGVELLAHVVVLHVHWWSSWRCAWGSLLKVEWQLVLMWHLWVCWLTRRHGRWSETLLLKELGVCHVHSRVRWLLIGRLTENWQSIVGWLDAVVSSPLPLLFWWWLLRRNTVHDGHGLLVPVLLGRLAWSSLDEKS